MARPRDASSAATWQRIVTAAREELASDGEAAGANDLSLRQVARRSGVSLGTIHYYFETREALLEACLDTYYDALRDLAAELATALSVTTRETAREIIPKLLRRMFRFAYAERAQLKLRALTNSRRGHLHPHRDMHERGPYLEAFSQSIARLVDIDANGVRMVFQTMSFVVMQYVLLTDAEVEHIVGAGGDVGRQAIEDHVVSVGARLVFATPPEASPKSAWTGPSSG